ncbi:aldehyde ferredoxin oxidoreductase family protein [Candidatus Latescibacterota bacterium]
MANEIPGYHGVFLEVDLSSRKVKKAPLSPEDAANYVGGRGFGIKLLWDRLKTPGIDALSPENILMFMPGPLSGFPVPYASRTCVITKSPLTSPVNSKHPNGSTVGYSNIGGFFGPEIRFAGYDGIIVTGKADTPVYIKIEDDKVEIVDARKYWGMKSNEFMTAIENELGDKRFETCYIGPSGENLVRYSAVMHTLGRAAGRGGVGCVMGSKNLKAVAVKGTQMPGVADHKKFLNHLETIRENVKNSQSRYGTASYIIAASDSGRQTVKNFREGTDLEANKIGGIASEQKIWVRDVACYCCPQACKKIGVSRNEPNKYVAEGPEYETGTMLGTNLLIHDLDGLMMLIGEVDELGFDQISVGNVIGFLMECYDKGYIDRKFLDGVDLTWGNVEGSMAMLKKIAYKEGSLGKLASLGVKALAAEIGQNSENFAIHSKGQEYAAHNIHANLPRGMCYITSNRGACHMSGDNVRAQNSNATTDSTTHCRFGGGAFRGTALTDVLQAITGNTWDQDKYIEAGERIFNLEKCFNYREGFRRADESLPERFYTEPFTVGPEKGAVVDRAEFKTLMDDYYTERDWDKETTRPSQEKLNSLGLGFAWEQIKNI